MTGNHRPLFVVQQLVRRDLETRFAGSAGGLLWTVLNPVILCLLYSFVFSRVLQVSPPEGFRGTYALFVLAGLVPWLGLQEAMLRGATAVSDQAHLVRKLSFPAVLLPLSALATALLVQLAGLVLVAAFAAVDGALRLDPLRLAAALALQAGALSGPIIALAAVNVFVRDLPQLLSPALQILFYLTPILYPAERVPASVSRFTALNPFADLTGLFRASLLGTPSPPVSRLALWALLSAVICFFSIRLFRRCSQHFSDLL